MTKNNKGYSLIEIAVGILMLTIFLLVSIGLFNGCYNNYRRIKQRNVAIDRAVYYVENMLQTDSDVLTGFFVQKLVKKPNQSTSNPDDYIYEYKLEPSDVFYDFVHDDFTGSNELKARERYAYYNGVDISEIGTPDEDDFKEYIFKDREYLINKYIAEDAKYAETHTPGQLQNGSYGFIVNDEEGTNSERYSEEEKFNIVINNERIGTDEYEYVTSNGGAYRVVKTISRIPSSSGKAYGNNVLRIKVDVYYSKDFSNILSDSNLDVITINTIKLNKNNANSNIHV